MVYEGPVRRGPKRRNMLAETRLLAEYLAERYPGAEVHVHFRVGSDPEIVGVTLESEEERRFARNFNRWADALVVLPAELVLIEATMWRATEKVGRLQEYLILAQATPELAQYRGRPLRAELLTAQHDTVAEELCRRLGFRYTHYEPSWFPEFLAAYPERRRRTPHAGMVAAAAEAESRAPTVE
jgi:hypothetical protein